MNRKIRYFIIGLGVIAFFVLAPLLILYVQGLSIDTATRRLAQTGIIAIKTDPSGAQVWLSGERKDTTPASLRFLSAGDYDISIIKEGYFTWHKRLPVFAGRVTWVNPNPNDLALIRNNVAPAVWAEDVNTSLPLSSDYVVYLTSSSIATKIGTDQPLTKTAKLPEPIVKLEPGPDDRTLVATAKSEVYLVDLNKLTFTNTSNLFSGVDSLEFVNKNIALGLKNGSLVKIDLQAKTQMVLKTEVSSYAVVADKLYLLFGPQGEIGYTNIPFSGPLEQIQNIVATTPTGETKKLLVNKQRQVFLLVDKTLYRLGSDFEELAKLVEGVWQDSGSGAIAVAVPGEISYYNPDENKLKLITRSTTLPSAVSIRRDLNYAFICIGGVTRAVELDDRDRRNDYTLYQGQNITQADFTGNNILWVKDSHQLVRLTVR